MICRSLRESAGAWDFAGMIRKLSPDQHGVKEKVRKNAHCVKTRTLRPTPGAQSQPSGLSITGRAQTIACQCRIS
jgi:hypothetical protein